MHPLKSNVCVQMFQYVVEKSYTNIALLDIK